MHDKQESMFTRGEDLPLFSGTPSRGQAESFEPAATGGQLRMLDTRPEFGTEPTVQFISGAENFWNHLESLGLRQRHKFANAAEEQAERADQDVLRAARDPDLIISAVRITGGIIQVTTADDTEHLVAAASYPPGGEYRPVMLLSACVLLD